MERKQGKSTTRILWLLVSVICPNKVTQPQWILGKFSYALIPGYRLRDGISWYLWQFEAAKRSEDVASLTMLSSWALFKDVAVIASSANSEGGAWVECLQAAARVSPGQRDRILDLRHAHLQKIEGIVRKRKDVVWELQQATVMPESACGRQTAFSKVQTFSLMPFGFMMLLVESAWARDLVGKLARF